MRTDRLLWVLCGVQAVLLALLLVKYNQARSLLSDMAARIGTDHGSIHETFSSMRRADLAHLHREVIWPALIGIDETGPAEPVAGPRLVVYLSEESCNVCQDRMLAFIARMGSVHPDTPITTIIRSGSRRFAFQLVRRAAVTGELFHDPAGDFAETNGLGRAPMIKVLYDNRVALAHYPAPSFPNASDPVYEAIAVALE